MSDYYMQLSREELLANLFMHTNRKMPCASTKFALVDFFQYSGLFYYYKAYQRFDITKEIMEFFQLTIYEMVEAVNVNTEDDFILLPEGQYGIYKLIDKNGDSVERILLNAKKLDTYLRTIDDGFGIEFYPVKRNLWYVVAAPVPEDREYIETYKTFIKDYVNNLNCIFYIDSEGELSQLDFQ